MQGYKLHQATKVGMKGSPAHWQGVQGCQSSRYAHGLFSCGENKLNKVPVHAKPRISMVLMRRRIGSYLPRSHLVWHAKQNLGLILMLLWSNEVRKYLRCTNDSAWCQDTRVRDKSALSTRERPASKCFARPQFMACFRNSEFLDFIIRDIESFLLVIHYSFEPWMSFFYFSLFKISEETENNYFARWFISRPLPWVSF